MPSPSQPTSLPEGVERYEIGEPEERGGPLRRHLETPMEPDPQGEWVKHSDHVAALSACRSKVVGEAKKACEEPIHALASTIGRARVQLDDHHPAGEELEDAAEAMKRLRDGLASLDSYTEQGEDDPHSWALVDEADDSEGEVCLKCGAQRDKSGRLAERATTTGGWPSPDCSLVAAATDLEATLAKLPADDQKRYREYEESVLRARGFTVAPSYTEQPEQEERDRDQEEDDRRHIEGLRKTAEAQKQSACGFEQIAGQQNAELADHLEREWFPRAVEAEPEQEDCERCGGDGDLRRERQEEGGVTLLCPDCNGTGKKQPGQPEEADQLENNIRCHERAILREALKEPVEELEEAECGFFACPGPSATEIVLMATCSRCAFLIQLREILAVHPEQPKGEEEAIAVERMALDDLPPTLKYEIEDGSYLGSCDMGGCYAGQEGWALCPAPLPDGAEWIAACEKCGTGTQQLDPKVPPPQRFIAFPASQPDTPAEEGS